MYVLCKSPLCFRWPPHVSFYISSSNAARNSEKCFQKENCRKVCSPIIQIGLHNFATPYRVSRGYAVPGPCDGALDLRAQHDWKKGRRLGEADNPGPAAFWPPLLDANISTETRGLSRAAFVEFVEFADAWDGGDAIETYADLDY